MLDLKFSARASVLALVTLACFSTSSVPAFGQESEAVSRQFSAKAGEIVIEAQNLMTSGDYSSALAKLTEAARLSDISAYERSIISQMQGANYYQLDQFRPAISAFEKALATGGLLPKEMDDMRVQIAQLMIASEQYALGAQRLEDYLNGGGPLKPEYIEMLTQAWVNAKDYSRALPWAEKWFVAATPKERKHFDILNFLYNKLNRPDRQADVVKEMIKRWPAEQELWNAWASLFANAGQDDDAFAVTKLLYLGGALTTEPELMKVVQYYSYNDMPYQAAQILEKELNAGRLARDADKLVQLATLFRQAREYARAIPVLEMAATSSGQDRAEKGKLYAQLGEALYNEGFCIRAETAFKQAINRGYDAGKAWTLIATCRYEDVQKQQKLSCDMKPDEMANAPKTKARQATIAAFEKVPSTSKQNRDAKKWISYIKAERLTFDKRCEFEIIIKRKSCFQEIKRAYDGQFVDGKLTLGNVECEAYLAEYDAQYRPLTEG